MEYIKLEEAAQKWGVGTRRAQILCAGGKVEGAVRFGRDWMIPKDAAKPIDGRTKAGRSLASGDLPLPKNPPLSLYERSLQYTGNG